MKRIIISILATFIVIILLFIFFMSTKVSILLNLDKVYLYQTEDNKIQVYRSDLFEPKDLNPTKLIKTINQKHSIYLLGNNYDNYIDARGVASSYVYIFGYGGDDVLIGSQGPDNIHGHEGHDLLVGCNGTDKIYGDDGNNYLITGAGGEYIDSNDSISYGCKLSDLANDLLNSDLSKFNKVPWYYIKAKEALGLSEEEFNTLKTQSSQPQNIINQMPQSKGSNVMSPVFRAVF